MDYKQVTQSINKILSDDDKCYKEIKQGAKKKKKETRGKDFQELITKW